MIVDKAINDPINTLLQIKQMRTIISFALAATLFACAEAPKTAEKNNTFLTEKMEQLITVSKTESSIGINNIKLNGKVSAVEDARIDIPAIVSGKAIKVLVSRGDQVKKGDVLAIIRSTEVAELKNELITAQNTLIREKSEYAAALDLFESGLLSNLEMNTAEGELKIAQSELNSIEQRMAILGDSSGDTYKVMAPINGIIEARNINSNSFVTEDLDEPMFTITNLDQILVELNIPESSIRYISEGLSVTMKSLSYPDLNFEGEISRVVRVLNPDSKVLKAKVILDNNNQLLLPEMFLEAVVSVQSETELSVVPSEAIVFSEGADYVVVKTGHDKFENRAVEVWSKNDGKAFIKKGVTINEEVVSTYPLLIFSELENRAKYGES